MEAKYMFNLKWPLPNGVAASFTAQGENITELMANAKLMYDQLAPKAAARTQANGSNGHAVECPEHHQAREGKWGLFCPARVDDGYCKWTPKKAKKEAAT